MLYFKSPLSWPESIPVTGRAQQRSDNGFSADMSLTDAINFLKDEIDAAGINHAVLYLDIEQPQVERLRKKVGSRTGICLHLKYREKGYIITCDRWLLIEHNIYAMHLALRQWLNMQRWGIGWLSMLMAGFEINAGYEINDIPTEGEDIVECFKVFGLGKTATLDDATAIYHRRAKTFASDGEKLAKLNMQMDEIRLYFQNKEQG